MVDWYFLVELLATYGFGARWIGWIKALLLSAKANFIINGEQKGMLDSSGVLDKGTRYLLFFLS